jgi:hypothetical protein
VAQVGDGTPLRGAKMVMPIHNADLEQTKLAHRLLFWVLPVS